MFCLRKHFQVPEFSAEVSTHSISQCLLFFQKEEFAALTISSAGVNRNGSTGKGGAKCGVGITFTSTARDELVFSSTAKINSIQSHIHTVTTSPRSAHSRSHHHTVARLFNPSVAPYLIPSVFHSQLCLSLFIALFLLVISFLRKVRASRRES